MPSLEELGAVLAELIPETRGDTAVHEFLCREYADKLIRRWPHIAGPERVGSVEELDALPVGSLILDADEEVGRVTYGRGRIRWIEEDDITSFSFVRFPAQVLFRPDATNPEEGTR